jgi:hypothetical protein
VTPLPRLAALPLLLLCLALAPLACGPEPATAPAAQRLPLEATLLDDQIVRGGALRLEVAGAALLVPQRATVTLDGALDGAPLRLALDASWARQGDLLSLRVPWEALAPLHPSSGRATFRGTLHVALDDVTGALRGEAALPDQALALAQTLPPALGRQAPLVRANLHQALALEADDLLLQGEGDAEVSLEGTFTPEGGLALPINARQPLEPRARRDQGAWRLSPGIFGIVPGQFQGSIRLLNLHAGGPTLASAAHEIKIDVLPTAIAGISPTIASRGQQIVALGQGFLPADPATGTSMYLQLEGTFSPPIGPTRELRGATALRLAPDAVPDHDEATIALRTELQEDNDGVPQLVNLSALTGTFEGEVRPILVSPDQTYEGSPWRGVLVLAPTRQVVFLKFLPGFEEALERYGLRNVAPEIRARILEVARRDYVGINITFTDQRPEGWAEYSILEIGGQDPNGVGLFGLDNTAGKDTRNLRLDDVIGGENADSGEQGFYVYGGVFLSSFEAFSPSLATEDSYVSPWFDTIFSPFMPALGGAPVQATEWPRGPRAPQIGEAIRVMGNVAGNTITHEIGHSLGLAFFPEDLEAPSESFHNVGDQPDAIMDSGFARPFEERAELDGQGPARFTPENRAYLETILPLP